MTVNVQTNHNFMSISRSRKRKDKPAATNIIPLHKRKVIESKQNAGGYYEGMPGVTVDEHGNRKFIEFVMTPEGYSTARVFAHPKIMKVAIQDACKNNKELNAIVLGSALDTVFSSRTPLSLLIRFGLMLKRRASYRNMKKRMIEGGKG